MAYPFPNNYGFGCYYPIATIGQAANVPVNGNPTFAPEAFFAVYPQFNGQLPNNVLDMFIAMAQSIVNINRWHESWVYGMCNFIAHFATIYLETVSCPGAPQAAIISQGMAKGLQASKAVGDVSVSYDWQGVDFEGWPQWKTTVYGRQFASMARLLGKAGMYVW